MRRLAPIRVQAAAALAASLALPALAGGGPGDIMSHEDNGTHFFGEVKDVAGLAPVEGARVKIAISGTRMFLVALTDGDGRFRLEGFGRDVPADKVEITCAKTGYRTVEALHHSVSGGKSAPIEIECLMAK